MSPEASRATKTEDPIHAYSQSYIEAMRVGDVNKLESLFEDEAIQMPPSPERTLYGKAEIRAWYQEYFRFFKLVNFTDTQREVTIAGDWAFERRDFMVVVVPVEGGNQVPSDGRIFNVWKRQPDGEWKI